MSWNAMVGITRSKAICVCGFRPIQRAWKYVLKCSLLFLCFVNYVNLINLIGVIGIEFNLIFQDFNYSGQIVVQKCIWECSTSPQTIILNHVKTALPGGPVQKKMFDEGNLPQDMLMKYDEMPCNHRILMICPIIFDAFIKSDTHMKTPRAGSRVLGMRVTTIEVQRPKITVMPIKLDRHIEK